MQHVVQIAFDFDDSKIQEICETSCVKNVEDSLKHAVLDKLLDKKMGTWSRPVEHATLEDPLQLWVRNEVEAHLTEWKDDIIAKAAKELAEHMRRSKTVRETFVEQMKEELK